MRNNFEQDYFFVVVFFRYTKETECLLVIMQTNAVKLNVFKARDILIMNSNGGDKEVYIYIYIYI